MALTYDELQSITNNYFMLQGGKAVNIYFDDSFNLDYFMKRKMGLWERPDGGKYIDVPLIYDESEADAYSRGEALNSDDREIINAAEFQWKHYYGNATVYRPDELKNKGTYAKVQLVATKVQNAQESLRKKLATDWYSASGDSSKYLSGLKAMTSESAGTPYGGIEEEDLVSADGTMKWEGKTTTTTEALSLPVIRTLRSNAKVGNGKMGKPDVCVTTESLFNVVKGILQPMQRFTEDKETTKAGFTNLVFEEAIIAADDYCTAGYMFALNSKHFGMAIHAEGMFARTKWKPLSSNIAGKTMKIYIDGNLICNRRAAHAAHNNLS